MLPAYSNSICKLSKKSIQCWITEEKVWIFCAAQKETCTENEIVVLYCQSIFILSNGSGVFLSFSDAGWS